jgi:hypothetical protein
MVLVDGDKDDTMFSQCEPLVKLLVVYFNLHLDTL